MNHAIAPAEAVDRRARSHRRLEAESTPCDPGLVLLPAEAAVRLPAAQDIVLRALALTIVACEATGTGEELVGRLIAEYAPAFTEAERLFFAAARDPREAVSFGWRFEAALPLLWAAGLVDALKRPDAQTPPFELLQRIAPYTRGELLAGAALRPAGEILDEADLNFCREHASRVAFGQGRPVPGGLDGGTLLERYRAFCWLLEGGGDWDAVVAGT